MENNNIRNDNIQEPQSAPNFVMVDTSGQPPVPASAQEAPKEASMEFGPKQSSAPQKKRSGKAWKVLLSLLLVICLGFGSGYVGAGLAMRQAAQGADGSILSQSAELSGVQVMTDSNINTAEAVAAKAIPSVVGISTQREVNYFSFFGNSTGIAKGVGTGIIVSEDGYIITNSHVISDGEADQITVQLTDGRELSGEVIWYDANIDLAILKIEAEGLVPAELGDSDAVNIGAYVVAIGNPLGMAYDRSVTQGVISGLGRSIQAAKDSYSSQVNSMSNMMQTDAAINSGNSGGPLLNSRGQVIGINTAMAPSAEGMGFAIPINTAKNILESVMAEGHVTKAYIGIQGMDVTAYEQYVPQYKAPCENGVYVLELIPDGPALEADLRVGDVIVGLDKMSVDSMSGLQRSLYNYKPGDTVVVKFYRNGSLMEQEVTLQTLPQAETGSSDKGSREENFSRNGSGWQGFFGN